MDLRDLQDRYHEVTEEKIVVGALILTVFSDEDGLVFKNDRTKKPKRLIIIGVDKQKQQCYGSVLVNTKPSPKSTFSMEYLSVQYLLRQTSYPNFLQYDSYVDCGVLFSIPFDKLKQGSFYGILNDGDKQQIFDILETTDTLSTKEKKRYGIKRR